MCTGCLCLCHNMLPMQVTGKGPKLDALKQKTGEEIIKSWAEHRANGWADPKQSIGISMIMQHAVRVACNSVRHLQVTRKTARLDVLKQKTAEEITKSGAEHRANGWADPMQGIDYHDSATRNIRCV